VAEIVMKDQKKASAPPVTLHESAGYRLNRAAAATGALFEQALAPYGVTRAQYTVLVALHDGTTTSALEIGRLLGADAASVSRLVDRLVAKELLARTPSTTDRRSIELALTAAGKKLIPSLKKAARSCNESYLEGISETDRARLFRTLEKIHANCRRVLQT
jgi:DNA-binding MarR family transcriptional regulator